MKNFGKSKARVVLTENGEVLYSIVTKEINRNGNKTIITTEPEIFIAVNKIDKDHLAEGRWAKYNPKSDVVIDSKITISDLIETLYCVLLKYDFSKEMKRKFVDNLSEGDKLKEKKMSKYIMDANIKFNENYPEVNLKSIKYEGKLSPITDALWEVYVYG
jgi:hypothetical protein